MGMATQLIDLQDSLNWRRVLEQLEELARLVWSARRGHYVMFNRESFGVELSRSSEALLLDLEDRDPIKNVVNQLIKFALRDQIDDCGDGGKVLVLLVVAMIRVYGARIAPLEGHERIQALKRFRVEAQGVHDRLAAYKNRVDCNPNYIKQYLVHELADLPSALVEKLIQYFQEAGEASHLTIRAGERVESTLETTKGYFAKTKKWADQFPFEDLRTIDKPKILVLSCQLTTQKHLVEALNPLLDSPGVVFCQGGSDLVPATITGNYQSGQRWMVYQIEDVEVLQDITALTGAVLKVSTRGVTSEDCGGASKVSWEGGQVCIQQWEVTPALERHSLEIQQRLEGIGEGGERRKVAKRLAQLTQDHYILHMEDAPDQVHEAWKERIDKATSAVRCFSHGAAMDYGAQVLLEWELTGRDQSRVAGLFQKEDRFPFPAGVVAPAWRRATQVVDQLLSTKIYLAKS